MGIYDAISQIAQKQCDKLYETKILIGIVNSSGTKVTINSLDFDIDDIILSKTFCNNFSGNQTSVICIQTQSCIFIVDEIGVI